MKINTSYIFLNRKYNLKNKLINESKPKNNNINHCFMPYFITFQMGNKFLSKEELVKKIGKENFPSQKILKDFLNSDKNLYEIHTQHYEALNKCSSLKEVKEKYPEFSDVINAKDIDISILHPQSALLKLIKQNTDIENLSLELLKKRYVDLIAFKDKNEEYFNLSKDGIKGLLNIKIPSVKYSNVLKGQKPDFSKKRSEIMLNIWEQDDGTMKEKAANLAKNNFTSPSAKEKRKRTLNSEEFKRMQSKKAKQVWQNDDETRREQSRKIAITVLQSEEITKKRNVSIQSEEVKEKHRKNMLERWKNDDGAMLEHSKEIAATILRSQEVREKVIQTTNTKEYRQSQSKKAKQVWQNDDGTRHEQSRKIASTILQSEEVREKVNKKIKSKEYRDARKEAFKRHPEITQMMKDIALEYPKLHAIIEKIEKGIAGESEKKYYNSYHKACENAIPGYHQIIADEYHNILVEWGYKK